MVIDREVSLVQNQMTHMKLSRSVHPYKKKEQDYVTSLLSHLKCALKTFYCTAYFII